MTKNVPSSHKAGRLHKGTPPQRMVVLKRNWASCSIEKNRLVKVGAGVDIHRAIGRFPSPKGGLTSGSYRYLSSHNILEKQERMGNLSGVSVEDFYANPSAYSLQVYSPSKNPLDEATLHHGIAYGIAGNSKEEKHRADRHMVVGGGNR